MPKYIVNVGYNNAHKFEAANYHVGEHMVTFFNGMQEQVGSYATDKVLTITRED